MKNLFKKHKKLEHGHLVEIAALCAGVVILLVAAIFIADGGMNRVNNFLAVNGILSTSQKAGVVVVTVTTWNATPSPATPGTDVTLNWAATNADQCQFSGGWFGDEMNPPVSSPPGYPGATYTGGKGGYVVVLSGNHGIIDGGVLNSSTAFYIDCKNLGPTNTGDSGWVGMTATVSAAPTCPANSFSSPWNSNSYLIYSGGQGSITNANGRYCVHNYSANSIYIPMATQTEWNDFYAQRAALNVTATIY